MNLKANLVKKVSKKGSEYYCIEINLTDTYKKIVFLDPVEIELLNATQNLMLDFDNLN